MSDRLQFLDELALRPLFDMGVAGSWIYAGFSIEREPGDTGMFRKRFTLKATKSKDGLVAGEFVLTMPYKRVSVPKFLPPRVFSTVERPMITDYLTTCIQDRRSMGTLVELNAPSLDRAMHEQPGSSGAAGVASFFRNVLLNATYSPLFDNALAPPTFAF